MFEIPNFYRPMVIYKYSFIDSTGLNIFKRVKMRKFRDGNRLTVLHHRRAYEILIEKQIKMKICKTLFFTLFKVADVWVFFKKIF